MAIDQNQSGLPPAVLNRLRKCAAAFGDYATVSKASGVPIGTLQKMMRGASEPRFSAVMEIAAAIGVSLDYLITGIGEESGDWETALPQLPRGQSRVPVYEGHVSAGDGGAVFDGTPHDYLTFPTQWLKQRGDIHQMHAIVVRGDSMEPELRSGDQVIIDNSQRSPREGVFAFNIDGWALIKRLRIKGAGEADLVSTNPAYPPITVRLDQEYLIVGRAIWVGKAIP